MVERIKSLFIDAQATRPAEQKSEQTRLRILEAGFEELYQNGFQGMRIDAVLAKTKLAKGALYHHFPNKLSLGYAIVDELIASCTHEIAQSLDDNDDPLAQLTMMFHRFSEKITEAEIDLGCPVNNLVQEMSGLDEGFKQRLSHIFDTKIQVISNALARGQGAGLVKSDIDPTMVAGFIVSSFNGVIGAGKCTGDIEIFRALISTLCDYIESLRSPDSANATVN